MNDMERFHFEPKETPFNVHDHQVILATLLGQEGNIDVELVQGPSGFVMKPNAARLTMKRGPGGTMSPWMCYVHQNFYPWVEQRQFREPSEGKSSALEIPKDVSRELSQNDVYLLTHLHSFQTQKLKGLERFISRFYGVNPEGKLIKRVPKLIHKFLTPTVLAGFFADSGNIVGKNDDLVFEVSQWKDDLDSVHRMVGAFQKAYGWSLVPRTLETPSQNKDQGDSQTRYFLVMDKKDHAAFLGTIAQDLRLFNAIHVIRYYPLRQKLRKLARRW